MINKYGTKVKKNKLNITASKWQNHCYFFPQTFTVVLTVPVLRLWLIISACKCCERALARDRGDGQFVMPVKQFTSAPQKIKLNVSNKSLHWIFTHKAWQGGEKKDEIIKMRKKKKKSCQKLGASLDGKSRIQTVLTLWAKYLKKKNLKKARTHTNLILKN